ncbi:hypothetical protein [Neorhizobium sp. JUb45]|uniref:hypothetical protein n=1 Tax=unclassified Neorhizobium TaxID=2629175 RepID=UPI0010522CFA|nr:hypothetical protein [Neorhizobium sp. JUb45]TCR02179.1 hypothetical protein EDF70_104460 [Neorhizobium sp. JUb45]
MKNVLLAAAIAVSSILPFAASSEAASVTVRTVERVDHRGGHHARPRHHREKCVVKKVRTQHHGRTVVRTTRVCR